MIKEKIKDYQDSGDNTKLLICDNCGQGLGITDNPDAKLNQHIEDLEAEHKNCPKPKHGISDIITEG